MTDSPDYIPGLTGALYAALRRVPVPSADIVGTSLADTLGAPLDVVATILRRSGLAHGDSAVGLQDPRRVFGVVPPSNDSVGSLYGLNAFGIVPMGGKPC